MNLVSKVAEIMPRHPFSHYGTAALEKPLTIDVYREWLAHGHHGTMEYMATHLPLKEEPAKLAPRALSAVVVAKQYAPEHPFGARMLSSLRTALYARGEDYHLRFKEELESLARELKDAFPSEEFLCFTDSAPILERDLAYRAGLGWIGKNTCVIHPEHGSLFFLGQILTSLPHDSKTEPVKDFCGTCDRCIRACPTQAIESPRRLNATKCISYWTIEARESAPESMRASFGDWFFGCDICQTVCPWNEKKHGRDLMRALSEPATQDGIEDLRWILSSSGNILTRTLEKTPLVRARPRGLKRNALLIIGNKRLHELKPEVLGLIDDPHLKEIARWALAQLT
jgi:epoxyqueuosine reductase